MDIRKLSDSVTCHQLSCIVVASFICPLSDDSKPLPYTSLTSRGNLILLLLELIQHIDMDWSGIKKIFEKYFENPETPLEILLNKLTFLCKDKGCELQEFIRSLDRLTICRKSLLGVFLRKVTLAYKKMTFSQIGIFTNELELYLNKAKAEFMDGEKALCIDDEMEMELSHETSTEIKESQEYAVDIVTHANQFIAQQSAMISSQNPSALPPKALQDKITEVLKVFPDNVNAHFLSYLNCSRVKEISQSVVELHQYFDRKKWKDDVMPSVEAMNDRTPAESLQARFKRFRYCALNLGILHFHQGHFDEAVSSLEEAVKMAQETSDQACLEHAMYWLLTIRGEENEKDITHLKSKDIETPHEKEFVTPQLQGLGILQRCRDAAFRGEKDAASVIHELHKAETAYPKVVNKMHVTKAALLDFYGMSSVALMTSQIPLYYGIDSGLYTVFNLCAGLEDCDYESHCLALCQVAKFHADEGLYNEAQNILKYADQQISRIDELQKWITICKAQISFEQAIMNKNLKDASSAAEIISVYDKEDANYRHCVVAFLDGDIKAASSAIASQIEQFEENPVSKQRTSRNPMNLVRLKLLMAEIYMACDDVPGALSYLLEARSLAHKLHTKGLESQALLMIALCKMHLGLTRQAHALLNQVMVHILAHGSLYMRASAFLCLVKCQFILLQTEDSSAQKAGLLGIIPYLDTCVASFRRLSATNKVCETLCLQAHVYNMLEYTSERNRLAQEFCVLKTSLVKCTSALYL